MFKSIYKISFYFLVVVFMSISVNSCKEKSPEVYDFYKGMVYISRISSTALQNDENKCLDEVDYFNDFYISKKEVSQIEWIKVMRNNPSYFNNETHPVDSVSWYSTIYYCNKRSLMEGLTPVYSIDDSVNPARWGRIPNTIDPKWESVNANFESNGYRLPTKEEWEYAAKGGNNSKGYMYSGGDNIFKVAWHYDNSENTTHGVGMLNPNELGLFDMTGNVREWCWNSYIKNSDGIDESYRIIMGSDAISKAKDSKIDTMTYQPANYRNLYLGFRVVRSM